MLRLYAIARRRGHLEFYAPVAAGAGIGWTDDLDAAWCIEVEAWAEMVREVLMRHGYNDTFVHVFHVGIE